MSQTEVDTLVIGAGKFLTAALLERRGCSSTGSQTMLLFLIFSNLDSLLFLPCSLCAQAQLVSEPPSVSINSSVTSLWIPG